MQWYEPILKELLFFVKAPVENTQILWVSVPLFITIIVMTFYFGLYKREELGWNTSVGNSIVLLFVCVDLLRTMYHYTEPPILLNYLYNPWKSNVLYCVATASEPAGVHHKHSCLYQNLSQQVYCVCCNNDFLCFVYLD